MGVAACWKCSERGTRRSISTASCPPPHMLRVQRLAFRVLGVGFVVFGVEGVIGFRVEGPGLRAGAKRTGEGGAPRQSAEMETRDGKDEGAEEHERGREKQRGKSGTRGYTPRERA
eukprot:39584-Rhodomonas_salina.1